MKYAICYDEIYDEMFQCEISDELAEKIKINPLIGISDKADPDIKVASRYRSIRHPEWNDYNEDE